MKKPTSTKDPGEELDLRQRREVQFHRDFAHQNADKIHLPVHDDVLRSTARRPWNAYWSTYDALLELNLSAKKFLVPGCGFGDDAIRLAMLGADVYASDLSNEILQISRARARVFQFNNIHFDTMPVENLTYPDNFFDGVFFNDILHHVNITATLIEVKRVLKPGAAVIINELYTHSKIQRIRQKNFVSHLLYPIMVRFIYGNKDPYITSDERKLNENELGQVEALIQGNQRTNFFLLFEGRLFPSRWPFLSKLDHAILKMLGNRMGRLLAGRFVLVGNI